jgi:phosphoglycerate dehydrogenase-like enzyme
MTASRPLAALVSAKVRDELGAPAPELPLECLASDPERPLAEADLRRIEIAFMSIDLVGESTDSRLAAGLATFFEQLHGAPNLRWLHVCSAGADRPVFAELRSRGVRLTTSSGANALEVSHTALAGFLALSRGLPHYMAAQQDNAWRPMKGDRMPRDIAGQTAVVIGLGPIGREIARLLATLGMHVIGVRRSNKPVPECAEVIPFTQLDSVLPRADCLVLACPITPETRGLVDARRLTLLPRGAYLVNVARGAVVVEEDVIAALRSGQLGGAFLDVFATEPLPVDSPLWDLPNTLISPHSAGYSSGLHGRTLQVFAENLRRFLAGDELRNEVL